MARITVEDCLQRENNRFSLVQLASKRTKQLLQGSSPRTSERKNKAVVTALREIADGMVRFMTEQETAKFEEDRREQIEAQRAAHEADRNRAPAFLGNALFSGTSQASALEQAIFSGGAGKPSDSDDEE